MRDQHRKPRAYAARRDCGNHLDDRGKLCPQRDQLRAAAQGKDLVERGAAREADRDDPEGQGELRRPLVVICAGKDRSLIISVSSFRRAKPTAIPHRANKQ
ncbi:MAG TPA: hypothetical protein VF004_13380 [Burkholderiales bacterium]